MHTDKLKRPNVVRFISVAFKRTLSILTHLLTTALTSNCRSTEDVRYFRRRAKRCFVTIDQRVTLVYKIQGNGPGQVDGFRVSYLFL